MQEFRPTSDWERGLLKRLLERPFPGSDQLGEQLQQATVRTIDDEGSFEIRTPEVPRAETSHRIPVEAAYETGGGVKVHFLLHVVNGMARELEIYKDDGSPIGGMPPIDQLAVLIH